VFDIGFRADDNGAIMSGLVGLDIVDFHDAPMQPTEDLVGTHATQYVGSDRRPYEIIGVTPVKTGKRRGMIREITVRELTAVPAETNDGFGRQNYTYHSDTEATPQVFTPRFRDGRFLGYCEKGQDYSGSFLHLGPASKYRDPHY
jgi:hypothetical protein